MPELTAISSCSTVQPPPAEAPSAQPPPTPATPVRREAVNVISSPVATPVRASTSQSHTAGTPDVSYLAPRSLPATPQRMVQVREETLQSLLEENKRLWQAVSLTIFTVISDFHLDKTKNLKK